MLRKFTITSMRAAAALERPTSRHILLALVAGERTLSELSQTLKLSLSLLTYHVDRLCRLDLVEIVGKTRRAGRPLKRYRAVAKQFFVPANLASRSPSNALVEELRNALERDRSRRKSTCTLYLIDDSGGRRMQRVGEAASGSAFEAWTILPMDAHGAENFANDLRALIEKYAGRKGGKAQPFLVHCAFARRMLKGRTRTGLDSPRMRRGYRAHQATVSRPSIKNLAP